MNDIIFKNFRKNEISHMRNSFNKAFSDYILPIHLSPRAFEHKILYKSNINLKYSVGSYYKHQLVGFIFQSINSYEDKKTAYNGGTGVISQFRGNNLTEKMYAHVYPKIKKFGVEQCVLEVLSINKPAIKVYERFGFEKSKFFHCLKLSVASKYLLNREKFPGLKFHKPAVPNWKAYQSFCDLEASFLDTIPLLRNNYRNETIIEARLDNQLIGFIIFNKRMGRVGHIAVNPVHRGKGIGSLLIFHTYKLCHKKSIYILNINERYYGLISFFLRLGFKNEIDQFELKHDFNKVQ
jgi:GNAT superfamily N-acetyltransferase